MRRIDRFVRKLRPAALASFVGRITGLTKRRRMPSPDGIFWTYPMGLGWYLTNGGYEPGMKAVLEKYLRPGGTFIDMGANEGYFSVIASCLVGPEGAVIAVEPQSRLQPVIQMNIDLNQCYNVRIVKAAVTSKSGPVTFELSPPINTGSSSLFRPTKYSYRQEEVNGLTLAEFFQRTGARRCDLMKVDVEGAEYDMFMNADDILRGGVISNIVLEIHNEILKKRGLSGEDLHQKMLASGYRLNTELGYWVYTFEKRQASS